MSHTRNAVALSLAAVLVSASAAMAAPTHRHSSTTTAPQARAAQQPDVRDPRLSYGATPQRYQSGPYYYQGDDNGSTWSYYPGYTAH